MSLQAAPGRAVYQEASSHHPTPTATILLVNDFAKWRLCVRSILRSHPQWKIVSEACDGNEAVQKAGGLQPDLIILDIGLPHMNGISAASLIRQATLAVGQADYLTKANAATELLNAITAVLAGLYTST